MYVWKNFTYSLYWIYEILHIVEISQPDWLLKSEYFFSYLTPNQ